MSLSDHKGKFALASSFAIMTASSTVYAQLSPSSFSEGEQTVTEQQRLGTQTTIRGIQTGVRKATKGRLETRQRFIKKAGGQGVREDIDTAFTEPSYFGPKGDVIESGLAGGEMLAGFGSFANFSLTDSESTAGGYKTDSGLGVVTLGFDKAVEDNFILGLSFGASRASSDSFFENGATRNEVTSESTSVTFAPYAAFILNENFYVDATLGVSGGENRLNHTNLATGAVNSSGDGNFSSRFLGLGINYTSVVLGDYGLQASASYTWSSTSNDDFTDDQGAVNTPDDESASQLILGGQIGRQLGMYVPYLFSFYEHDLIRAPRGGGLAGERAEDGRHALRLGAGVDAQFLDNLVGSVELNTVLLKAGYEEVGLSLNIRYDF